MNFSVDLMSEAYKTKNFKLEDLINMAFYGAANKCPIF